VKRRARPVVSAQGEQFLCVYLQRECHLKPASINRTLISLKCSFAWLVGEKLLSQRPAKVVKRQEQEQEPSRHLSDQEEQGLVAAATTAGCVRDRTLMLLLLHTGLRAREACTLRRDQVQLSKRSGPLRVTGKRNTYRAVPLGSMVRAVLLEYLAQLRGERPSLFPSPKTNTALSERALASLVAKYAHLARLTDISPHDLRHHFGYRMAETVPLHLLAHMMGNYSLDTTRISVQGTQQDVQHAVETIA
jgi:integrase/recombinase XerD